jgi:RNA polymerase sigma-70 factor, ECF subfamily
MNMRITGNEVNEDYLSSNNLPAQLYEKHAPGLLSLCLRYCGNIQDAEDVLHEGFIKIIRNLQSFKDKGKGSFEGWTRKIMVNTALNFIRDHAKERKFLDIEPLSDKIDFGNENEEDDNFLTGLAEKVSPNMVMEMICDLPPGYRAVFNLYVFESFSHKEIAHTLNCTENTSKSQLSKARAMLRKKLTQLAVIKTEYHEKA